MTVNISRYKNRIKRSFDVEVLTPMFLGGADNSKADLRTPPIKGLLRFWWRATCGVSDIRKLKERESDLFGDSSQKAAFSMQVEIRDDYKPKLKDLPRGKQFEVKRSRGSFKLGIIDYLAFGLKDHKKGYLREHYPAGTVFRVNFTFAEKHHETAISQAFEALIHFGGLGARSRNGFGSLGLLQESKPSITFEGDLKDFTSTSKHALFFLTPKQNYRRWEDALSDIGMAYRNARLLLEPKHKYNKRLLIAKPIIQTKVNQRHSKPYFLHVGKTSSGYYGQILFMPYNYYGANNNFSEKVLLEYQETFNRMNKALKKELAGGAA